MTPTTIETSAPVAPAAPREPDWNEAPESGRRATLIAALQRLWEIRPGPACIMETGTLRDDLPRARDGDGWSTLAFGWYAAATGGRVCTVDVSETAMATSRRLTASFAGCIDYAVADSVAFLRKWGAAGEGRRQKAKGKKVSDTACGPHPQSKIEASDPVRQSKIQNPKSKIEASDPVRQSKIQNRKSKIGTPQSAIGTPATAGHPQSAIDLLYLDSMDYEDREASEAHHLAEAEAALPALAEPCLVLIDDTRLNHGDIHPLRGYPTRSRSEGWTGKGARAVPFLLEQGFELEWARGGQVLISRGAPPRRIGPVLDAGRLLRVPEARQLARLPALRDVPGDFAAVTGSPGMAEYLHLIRQLAQQGRTCEIGTGPGYGAAWLSLRGADAEGREASARLVERARQVNSWVGGRAFFSTGGLFDFVPRAEVEGKGAGAQGRRGGDQAGRWKVIHHWSVLHRYSLPWIRAALARQVAVADWVVFSVPSVYYGSEPEWGDERLLPLEEWRRIFEPFDVAELRYSGDPALGGREHVLAVLRGQPVDDRLRELIFQPEAGFPQGVTAIVHTRNEARHLAECLETLRWADEVIVCDMESSDETVAIARRAGAAVMAHPYIADLDRARNVSAMRARYRWILFLDADERFPPALAPVVREFIAETGDRFAGAQFPFAHHFLGRPLLCISPGYKAPSLLRNGAFVYNARPHTGATIAGPIARFPAEDAALHLPHFSNETLFQLREKQNRYTESEAAHMQRDGETFHWREAVRAMVRALKGYYDGPAVRQDDVHGLLWSLYGGIYELEKAAKLYERRFRARQLLPEETEVPPSTEALLEHALAVAREHSPQRTHRALRVEEGGAAAVVSGPLLHPSGYGEESRELAFALEEAGIPVAAHPTDWGGSEAELTLSERGRLQELAGRAAAPGFAQLIQEFPHRANPHPAAGRVIVRTMFETDRLPAYWVSALNRPEIDVVCVPSEFNRESFARAGVAEEKLVVVPGCIGGEEYGRAEVWTCGGGDVRTRGSKSDSAVQGSGVRGQESDRTTEADPSGSSSTTRAVQGSGVRSQESDRTTEVDRSGSSSTTSSSSSSSSSSMEAGIARPYTFLSIFDWTLHKGWDVLLRAFLQAFAGRSDVALALKVWSSLGYGSEGMRAQAAEFAHRELGHDLLADPRIRWVEGRLMRAGMAGGILPPRRRTVRAAHARGDGRSLPRRGRVRAAEPRRGLGPAVHGGDGVRAAGDRNELERQHRLHDGEQHHPARLPGGARARGGLAGDPRLPGPPLGGARRAAAGDRPPADG